VAILIIALVDPSGRVVNKIVVDTTSLPKLPPGWSMHEWTDADEAAYERYLASQRGQ